MLGTVYPTVGNPRYRNYTSGQLILVADNPGPPVEYDDTVEEGVERGLAGPLLPLSLGVAGVVDLARVPLPRHRVAHVTLKLGNLGKLAEIICLFYNAY